MVKSVFYLSTTKQVKNATLMNHREYCTLYPMEKGFMNEVKGDEIF